MATQKPTTKIVTAAERLAARPAEEVVEQTAPEVTLEVTKSVEVVPARPLGIAPRPLFAPEPEPTTSVPSVRPLSAKTLAEQAAGKEVIAQYS